MSFSLDLKAFSDRTNAKANAVVRKIIFDLDTSLVQKNPVGDALLWKSPPPKGYVGGRSRANWQHGEDVIPEGELWSIHGPFPDKNEIQVSAIAGGKTHYLVNNLPYMWRLENGWSTQAPAGMVGLTVIEFQPIVKAAIAAVQQ